MFWQNREGEFAPAESSFHLIDFFSKEQILHPTYIHTLPPFQKPKLIKKSYFPTFSNWEQIVEKALHKIEEKALQKVVLARKCILEFDQPLDPFAITSALAPYAQGAYLFCIEMKKGAFLGISPERLYLKKGDQLFTEAMAGTRPIQTPEKELLESPKDLREFFFVQEWLEKKLSLKSKAPPSFGAVRLYKTPYVQHLYSQAKLELLPHVLDQDLLSELHPTPALCGVPQEAAYAFLKEEEPFSRGFYCSALGWRHQEESEWAVGIRSCLIEGSRAILYSGVGIVEGSDPKQEWQELDDKLRIYRGILDC